MRKTHNLFVLSLLSLLAMDLFEMMFGMGGGRRNKEKRTKDIMYQLKVSTLLQLQNN